MKRLMLIGVLALATSAAVSTRAAEVALIPMPQEMSLAADGAEFTADANWQPKVDTVEGIPAEGYELSVTPDGALIRSSDAAGEFYARETLKQLARLVGKGKDAKTAYPCVEIKDSPAFGWRGVHIDECRHFFGKETVKHVLDLMAMHKMNVLHWHLTDDQGWRLDIPGYPALAEKASVRVASPRHGTRPNCRMKESDIRPMRNGEKYGPYFYTEADVKEIVDYAAARHIRVVPEIELPGHVYAAISAYPSFACFPERLTGKGPLCAWGIEQDVLCVGNDAAIKFLEDVLDYVCRVFPCDTVHIGGDECPQTRWKSCPKCQARIKAEDLKDETELQPWITRHFIDFLAARGKRAIGWDEYLHGNVPPVAIGMNWRPAGGARHKFLTPRECVERGHDMVMTPRTFCYTDYGQGLADDPFQYIGGCVTLEKVYSFDPCEGIPEDLQSHILGGQCNNWSEYTWNVYDLDWKMWPRTCAMAEVLWTFKPRPGFADFKRRMAVHRKRLIFNGVNCAPLE